MKIKWKVSPAPTGRYRSFEHRSWPTGYYDSKEQKPAVFLSCKVDYRPHLVKVGDHPPITIIVLNHQDPESLPGWKRMQLTIPATTLAEAKERAQAFLDHHIEWWPVEPIPSKV